MNGSQFKTPFGRLSAIAATAVVALALNASPVQAAKATQSPSLDSKAMTTLKNCRKISSSCAETTKGAAGVLVFPQVVKADLIIGGEGGKGVLIENGKVTGYYSIGAVTGGLQAGIRNASQVYVFRTEQALNDLKKGSDWKVGATAGVTVVEADKTARGTTGDVVAYVFNSKGLQGGVSLDLLDIWKTGKKPPRQ